MLLVPLIFRRIGYRRALVLALAVLALRNQAQGLVNLILAGVGVFASNFIFHAILKSSSPTPWTTTH